MRASLHDYNTFLSMVDRFRELYMASTTARCLRKFTTRNNGRMYTIASPQGWTLMVSTRTDMERLTYVDLKAVCYGREPWVVPIGTLSCDHMPGMCHLETSLFFALGEEFRVFVYDADAKRIHLAARDFEEFCHCGLGTVACLYEKRRAFRCPAEPEDLAEQLDGETQSLSLLSTICASHEGRDLVMQTPCGEITVKICGSWDSVMNLWPFTVVSRNMRDTVRKHITQRLCCPWKPFGAVGRYDELDVFRALVVLLIDCPEYAIYTYNVLDGAVERAADNMPDFMRSGCLRILTKCRWYYGHDLDRGDQVLDPKLDATFWVTPRKNRCEVRGATTLASRDSAYMMAISRPDRYESVRDSSEPKTRGVVHALAAMDYNWRPEHNPELGDVDDDVRDYCVAPLHGGLSAVYRARVDKALHREGHVMYSPRLLSARPPLACTPEQKRKSSPASRGSQCESARQDGDPSRGACRGAPSMYEGATSYHYEK